MFLFFFLLFGKVFSIFLSFFLELNRQYDDGRQDGRGLSHNREKKNQKKIKWRKLIRILFVSFVVVVIFIIIICVRIENEGIKRCGRGNDYELLKKIGRVEIIDTIEKALFFSYSVFLIWLCLWVENWNCNNFWWFFIGITMEWKRLYMMTDDKNDDDGGTGVKCAMKGMEHKV